MSQITHNIENQDGTFGHHHISKKMITGIKKWRIGEGSLINYIKNNNDKLYQLYFGK